MIILFTMTEYVSNIKFEFIKNAQNTISIDESLDMCIKRCESIHSWAFVYFKRANENIDIPKLIVIYQIDKNPYCSAKHGSYLKKILIEPEQIRGYENTEYVMYEEHTYYRLHSEKEYEVHYNGDKVLKIVPNPIPFWEIEKITT